MAMIRSVNAFARHSRAVPTLDRLSCVATPARLYGIDGARRTLTSSSRAATYDVTVVGGGIIGSSIAYFLSAQHTGLRIAVVERDPTYTYASTALSASGIRHQFSTKENVEISVFGSQFLRTAHETLSVDDEDEVDVGFREAGYLFLAGTDNGTATLRANQQVQLGAGADNVLLGPDELHKRFPWLNTSDLQLGCLGLTGEGWFDPYSTLMALRRKAVSLGVEFIQGEVVGTESDSSTNNVNALQVKPTAANGGDQSPTLVHTGKVVSAAGAWVRDFLAMLPGPPIEFPVFPRRRCIFVVKCQTDPSTAASLAEAPLVVDTTGVYFRPEGDGFITGLCPPEETDLDHPGGAPEVDFDLYDQDIWPALAHRVPAFEALRQQNAWAGLYAYNTFDQNVILGPHPTCSNVFFANGFSGHGLQQAPAVGRAVSEYILHGTYRTLDLHRFHYDRILNNQPITELNVV